MIKSLRSIIVIITLLGLHTAAAAAVDLYPRSEVARGLKGRAYTVIEGTEIESFDVEILGVLPHSGPSGDLILVQVSGDAIDRVGGIAAGMSGSPVYLDGRLLGAIGYGLNEADQTIGLVTPADDMMRVMELIPPVPDGERSRLQGAVEPLATPISLSGFGERSRALADRIFRSLGSVVVQGGGVTGSDRSEAVDAPVAPGSALSVQLMWGDMEISAIGTVTAVEGDRFIAFGHPMFSRGSVDYLASGASILRTVTSPSRPFKIGNAGQPFGTIRQDRGAAIAGRIGEMPPTARLKMEIRDDERGVESSIAADLVRDDGLVTPLVVLGALEGLDRGLDRLGAGTAVLKFQIEGEGLPRPVIRENRFYSPTDIAGVALWELYDAVRLLQSNPYRDPSLTGVSLWATVDASRKTARIERARPLRRRVRAGGELEVEVTLAPYRSDPFSITIPVRIPEGTQLGPLTIIVRGGDEGFFSSLSDSMALTEFDAEAWDASPELAASGSLERLIEAIESQARNDEIVVEFYPGRAPFPEDPESVAVSSDNEPPSGAERDGERPDPYEPVQTTHRTEYVVQGTISFEVVVAPARTPPVDDEPAEPGPPVDPDRPLPLETEIPTPLIATPRVAPPF